jgi:hypothetical protein
VQRLFRKQKARLFFSEEKNQKTFISAVVYANRPWPDSADRPRPSAMRYVAPC